MFCQCLLTPPYASQVSQLASLILKTFIPLSADRSRRDKVRRRPRARVRARALHGAVETDRATH
jgi:hypothetical protein